MVLCLFVFVIFIFSGYSQEEFTFLYPKEFEDEEVKVSFYTQKTKKELITKNSKLVIAKNLIENADSITASFSFYTTRLKKRTFYCGTFK